MIVAAFDVGSGATKCCVAEISENGNGCTLVKKVLANWFEPVLLGNAFRAANSGRLPDPILSESRSVIRGMRNRACGLGATRFFGVATAVFREAINGEAFLASLSPDVDVRLVDQDVEGELGFLTAVAAAASSGGEQQPYLSWDSGGASFQLSTRGGPEQSVRVTKGLLGSSSATKLMVEGVQAHSFAETQCAVPASQAEMDRFHALITDELDRQFAGDPAGALRALVPMGAADATGGGGWHAWAIGGHTCAFRMAELALGASGGDAPDEPKVARSAADIRRAISRCVDKSASDLQMLFPEPSMLMPKLGLILAVMEKFSITSYTYYRTNGNTLGIIHKFGSTKKS